MTERFKPSPAHGVRPIVTDRPLVSREYALYIAYNKFFYEFKEQFPTIKCVIAGSIRREKPFVHDIDIIVVSKEESIRNWCKNKLTDCKGFFYLSGKLKDIDTQIWFCDESNFGPMLLMRTGPMEFNRKLAMIAKRMGGTYSELGLFKGSPSDRKERIDDNTESNIIWLILHRTWIHPRYRDA